MRLTSNTKASSRRSKREWTFAQINFVAGRRGAVVEDDFYNKLKKLNVQAGKRNKILLAHVQRICEAHHTVMRSYYQQIHKKIGDFWVLARILKNCTYKPRVYMYIFPPKISPAGGNCVPTK